MRIMIEVDSTPGEESLKMTEITAQTLEAIIPFLEGIKRRSGYIEWAEDIYINNIVESILPNPSNGFSRVIGIYVFNEEPYTIEI